MPRALTERLPRGRHRLTRDQVATSQRTRLITAMANAMTDKGYVKTSVADILEGAGVSRETFYQHYSSKLDCFTDAFDLAGDMLLARLDRGDDSNDGTPLDRFDRALGTYLEVLTEEPAMARVFLVEAYAAGPAVVERRAHLQDRIIDRMADLLDVSSEQGRFTCRLLVAGVSSLVTASLVTGDTAAIGALRPQVVALVQRTFGSG